MRDLHPTAAAIPGPRDRGDGTRMLAVVLVASGASAPLALIVLATGGGLLMALLAYGLGGSALAGALAGALVLRESKIVAGAASRVRRLRAAAPHRATL
jgi:hypothetical protein